MESNKKYKLSKKNAAGKWWSHGSVKQNSYGNFQAGFKVTAELKEIFAAAKEGEWINFALFEEDDKANKAKEETESDIPF